MGQLNWCCALHKSRWLISRNRDAMAGSGVCHRALLLPRSAFAGLTSLWELFLCLAPSGGYHYLRLNLALSWSWKNIPTFLPKARAGNHRTCKLTPFEIADMQMMYRRRALHFTAICPPFSCHFPAISPSPTSKWGVKSQEFGSILVQCRKIMIDGTRRVYLFAKVN